MRDIFFVHWNSSEAEQRAAVLRDAGHRVRIHSDTKSTPSLKDPLPEVLVISLDRLPSHGRAIAEWLWEAKSRRQIPIIFAGGAPDKVAVTRQKFPAAVFCSIDELLPQVESAAASVPANTTVSVTPKRKKMQSPKRSRATAAKKRSSR
jgi:hypothetical protein